MGTTLQRASRRSSSIHSVTLNRACSGNTEGAKNRAIQSGGEQMMKGFHASSLALLLSCLLCLARRKVLHCANELLTHKCTEQEMQDQSFMT